MSDAPKVEEPVVAAPVVDAPVAAEPVVADAAPEAAAETPAAEAAPAAEEPAVVAEVKPVEEGVLGYKGPGLLKSFIFQKKFFFFGTDEAVESKHLSSYLRGEKPEAANKNAAWASHTGKGLLFFTKKAAEKAHPAGIINLSEISDIKTEGHTFFFTVAGHKHTFEAANAAERDAWVASLKTKEAEAKELAPTVTESETYKKTHSSLSKPVIVAAAVPKKSTEVKAEPKAEDKAEATEEAAAPAAVVAAAEPKEEKKEVKARKSRSASRKRTSIFGAIPGFGKKEEKTEVKEEAAAPAAEASTEAAVAEPAVEAAAEPVVAEPVTEAEPAAAATEEATPAEATTPKAKRNSIFGTIKSQFSTKDKKPEADAPAVPAKDTEPVAETAPVIPAVESTEPLAAAVATEAPAETAATNGATPAAEAPVTKTEKRKSSLPWLSKKEKAVSSDDEAEKEKPLSPFAKLRATVKGKSPKVEKAAEKATEEPAAEVAATDAPAAEAAPAAAVEEPVVAEPIPAATAQVSATA